MGYYLNKLKLNPIKGFDKLYISAGFGERTFYNPISKKVIKDFHNGMYITTGNTIVAVASGKVVEFIY